MSPDPLSVTRRLAAVGARAVDDLAHTADRIAELPALLGAVRDRLERLLGIVEALAEDVRELRDELRPGAALPVRLDALQQGLDDLRPMLAALREDVVTTQREVAPMDDDLDAVERAVREMAPALQAVRDEVSALRQDLSSVPFVGRR